MTAKKLSKLSMVTKLNSSYKAH